MNVQIKNKDNSKELRDLNYGDFFLSNDMLGLYITDIYYGNVYDGNVKVYSFNDECFVTYPDDVSVVPVSPSDIRIIVNVQ